MRTLSRYFAGRYLGLFGLILIVSTLTIVVIEMLLNLDDMLSVGEHADAPLVYLMLRIPSYYLRELIPITSFGAAFFALGLGSYWFEVSAAKAGGISPDRLVAPIVMTAVVLGCLTFVLGETWIVNSTRQWNRFVTGGGPPISYREGAFWYHRGRTIYNISESDPSQRTLRGVRLFDLDARGRLVRSVDAALVDVEDNQHWRFHDATIRTFTPEDSDAVPRVERLDEVTLAVADPNEVALIHTDLHTLTVPKLRAHADRRAAAGDSVHRVNTVLYTRFVEPVTVVLFALLAAPFGLRARAHGGFGLPVLFGIATLACWFALRSVTTTLASEGVISAATASNVLVLSLLLAGSLHLRFIDR